MNTLDFFRCCTCGKLYERQEFTERKIVYCEYCGARRFRRAGVLGFFGKVRYLFHRPKDFNAIREGAYNV